MAQSILVADDQQETQQLLRLILESHGFRVVEARDGQEALMQASSKELAAAILDINMPQMDGITACKRLRSNPATADLPIIILSANFSAKIAEAVRHAGATRHLSKPVVLDELMDSVYEVLSPW